MSWLLLLFCTHIHAAELKSFLNDLDNFKGNDRSISQENERRDGLGTITTSRKLFWAPTLSTSLVKTRNIVNTESVKGDYWEVDGSWNLFRGGSDYQLMRSATAAQTAQNFNLLSVQSQVEVKAAQLILRRILLDEIMAANLEQKRQREEALRISKIRYGSGRISRQELSKLEVDLSQQLNKVRATELERIDLEQKIKAAFVTDVATHSWPLQDVSLSQLQLGETSNEIQKLQWTSRSREHLWRSAQLKHLPTLDLSVSYRGVPTDQVDRYWDGKLVLTLPLWDQMATRAEQAKEYIDYKDADYSYQIAQQEERTKRESLEKKLKIYKDSVLETKGISKKAEQLYKDTLVGFRYGKISVNDLFIEQNRFIDTRLDYSQNQFNYHMALVEACGLSGKLLRDCIGSIQ